MFCDQLGDYLEGLLQEVLDYLEKAFQAPPGEFVYSVGKGIAGTMAYLFGNVY